MNNYNPKTKQLENISIENLPKNWSKNLMDKIVGGVINVYNDNDKF